MTQAGNTIQVENLSKTYQVPEREGGFGAAVRSFFKRTYRDVHAVDHVSFQIEPGEVVGFLGPNGAGKTTTLKMLSGLLHPTAGMARVLGFTPWELKPDYLRCMTLVMGQRSRLSWDIPAADSFLLNQAIYRIPDGEYKRTFDELDELLELTPILKKPVRNLSLGERMKCELAVGLLHRPKILFLDEPTIGLDITAQVRIRAFLQEYNRRSGATILLTSHYMADVTALCERVIIIHQGQLKYDGGLTELSRQIAPFKLIGITLADGARRDLSAYGLPVENDDDSEKSYIQVSTGEVTSVTARLLADLPVHDIIISDPPIEAVIEQAFRRSPASGGRQG
jgi:ABC-2 type transport system ATP-binding protein